MIAARAGDERKRVAIVIPDLGGGGAERVALATAIDLVERGHDVDLLLLQVKGDLLPLVPEGVRVVDLKARRILAALAPLARYLRGERPDALHAVMWPVTVVAILAHRLARSDARLVVSDHVAYSHLPMTKRQRLLLRWTSRLFYPAADHRIVVSSGAADDLARYSGIPRDRFEVIYNPVTPPKEMASTPEIDLIWGKSGPRIITVGSLKMQKNHALLLDAFARMDRRDARLMILGQGPLRRELEQQVAVLGIADRVIMPGFALDPWPYLASADLFVLSSDYEGYPLVLIEAMFAGLKIVSTDCKSGPGEILDRGRYGRLVPCRDPEALAEAMNEALSRQEDSRAMRARAAELSVNVLDRYAEILTS